MSFVKTIDNNKLFYRYISGKKDPLVFIHGWNLNYTEWQKEVKFFKKKGHAIIYYDLRGHGKSESPKNTSDYNISLFVDDLDRVIEACKIKKPTLIGHSLGGMIIIAYQKKFSEKVKRIVLIDSTYRNPLKDVFGLKFLPISAFTIHLLNFITSHLKVQKKHFKEVNFSKFKNHDDFYYWLKGVTQIHIKSLFSVLLEMIKFNEKKHISTIITQTLLIVGQNDIDTPVYLSKYMQTKIKKSHVVVIPNASHDTPITNWKEVCNSIDIFVNM